MINAPVPEPARGALPDHLTTAADNVSRTVWRMPYEPLRGPLHYATGPHWTAELQRRAIAARRLAEHCEQLVQWWLEEDRKANR